MSNINSQDRASSGADNKIITDLTQGNLTTQMLKFALPFMFSNAMQILYALVDMIVVGRFLGKNGLSAVSTASQIFTLLTMISLGFSNGAQVYLAQLVGMKRSDRLNRAIGTLFSTVMLMGAGATVIGLVFGRTILNILNTPADCYDMAVTYILVCSAGVLFTYGYNMVAAALRGMGDSRHPFYFILLASVVNIVLDLLFVGPMHMGVAGAALATIIGQAASFLYSLIFLYRNRDSFGFDFKLRSFRIEKRAFTVIMRMGIPFAMQFAAINLSMMFVMRLVNSLGVAPSACFGVGVKVDDIVNKITAGISAAVASMVGQNYARGQLDRVKKIVNTGTVMALVGYLVFIAVYFLWGAELFGIFTDDPDVIALSPVFIKGILFGYPAMILLKSCNGFVQGVGNAKLSFGLAFVDALFFRLVMSYGLGILCGLGFYGFIIGYGCGAYGTVIPGMIYYLSGKWEKRGLLE